MPSQRTNLGRDAPSPREATHRAVPVTSVDPVDLLGIFSLADWDGNEWIPALYAYASCASPASDYREAALRVLQERAESWVQWGQLNSYRFVKSPYSPVGYGSVTTPHGADLLARVHHLTGDPTLREWILYNADAVLGTNWSGWSWVTGLGPRSVRRPLHNPSLGDGIDDPVPGITVYGPSRQESSSSNESTTILPTPSSRA